MNNYEELNTEQILWLSIKDIENGNAKFVEEDSIDGWLKGRNKDLSKMNVSQQSAKYNVKNNNKPISRPTIDKYKDIIAYIESKTTKKESFEYLEKEIKKQKKDNIELKNIITEVKEQYEALAFQNYKLLEINKNLSNLIAEKTNNTLKIIK